MINVLYRLFAVDRTHNTKVTTNNNFPFFQLSSSYFDPDSFELEIVGEYGRTFKSPGNTRIRGRIGLPDNRDFFCPCLNLPAFWAIEPLFETLNNT